VVAEIPQKLLLHPYYNTEVKALQVDIDAKAKDYWQKNLKGRIDYDLIPIYMHLIRERRDSKSWWKPYIGPL